MLPDVSNRPLTPNARLLLAKVIKPFQKFAQHSNLSDGEAAAMVLAALSHASEAEGRGGSRKGAGRASRDWQALTGHDLGGLQLRIIIEQALVESRTGKSITEKTALGRVLKWRGCLDDDASLLDNDLGLECEALFKAFQHARRRVPSFPPRTKFQQSTRDERMHERLLAYANFLNGSSRPADGGRPFRLGPSWTQVGRTLIVDGRLSDAKSDTA